MRWLALPVALLASLAFADTIEGKVIRVADGDSLTLSVSGPPIASGRPIRIRLDSIDAPELAQRFGKQARDSLAELCSGKDAVVQTSGRDFFKREIGKVRCAGTDANAEQVRRGMAWVFRKYAPRESPLYQVEAEAKAARRGLWADPKPVEPWGWRRTKGRSEVQ